MAGWQKKNRRKISLILLSIDIALIYGITGGVSHYINKLDVAGSVKDALLENLFDTSAYL